MMQRKDFEELFKQGLKKLYEVDAALLDRDFNINERTITHRLAYHLTGLFPEFDIDCEYNRMMDHTGHYTEGDYWVKTVNIEIEEDISGDDTEAKTVFPDIIIHKRKTTANLAVIEVKLAWKNQKKNFDYHKLKAYKNDLKYTYAIYLELNADGYSYNFF